MVFEIDVAGRPLEVHERDKLTGRFATHEEVRAAAERMETWSRLLAEHLLSP